MGSGKYLIRAINKYGIENFTKEILYVFDNEKDMNAKEKELVTKGFVLLETNYNLCEGGQGGFSYVNRNGLNTTDYHRSPENAKSVLEGYAKKYKEDPEFKKRMDDRIRKQGLQNVENGLFSFKDKKHSTETKQQMSKSHKGKHVGTKNSQFGTMWITNGTENKKIQKDTIMPIDWYKGRTYNKL